MPNQAAEAVAACRSTNELRLQAQFGSIDGCARIPRRSLESVSQRGEIVEADQCTAEAEESEVVTGATIVAGAEAANGFEPGKVALDNPAMPAEPFAGVDAPTGDPRGDAARPTGGPALPKVVALVGVHLERPGVAARPPPPNPQT